MAVIEWFRSIEMKENCTFTNFDIVEFYPTISVGLLNSAISFAKRHVKITSEEVDIIHHSRKSLLLSDDKAWMKKEGSGLFDVAMGSYDSAEVCELVGMFAPSQLPKRYDRCDIGLHRDDGLAVFRGMSGSMAECTKNNIAKFFNNLGLHITIQTNLKTLNFLNVAINLCNGKYYPYLKPNDRPFNIKNRLLNHPPSILKHLSAAIRRCLIDILLNAEVFKEAAPLYNNALKDSRFQDNIKYAVSRKAKKLVQRKATRETLPGLIHHTART